LINICSSANGICGSCIILVLASARCAREKTSLQKIALPLRIESTCTSDMWFMMYDFDPRNIKIYITYIDTPH
jgi:hypothetical protein